MKFRLDDHNDFSKQYDGESDRASAILASSFLDNCLENFLKEKLADHKIKDNLFKGYGPLSSFSARTDIALLLGLIPEHIYQDLKIIRKIRNEFAHSTEQISFSKGKIKDFVSNLQLAKGYPRSDGSLRVINGARQQFLSAISWALIHIETERDRTVQLKITKVRFEEAIDDS